MARETNVAYDGTLADLGDTQSFSWKHFCSSTERLTPATGFAAINDSPVETISPKDLFMESGSVPPSTAFTNLTTPGSAFIDTPSDRFEGSPMFDSLDAPEVWPSLFDNEEPVAAAGLDMFADDVGGVDMVRTTSASSQMVVHPGGMSRKRSSVNASPLTSSVRASSAAGIHKRDKPLAPSMVDPNDVVAVKRARNTAAARKSRDKKFQELEAYKQRIEDLEKELEHWKSVALGGGKQ